MLNLIQSTRFALDRNEIPMVDRQRAQELMICEALAGCLPLPTSPVKDAGNYFRMTLRQEAAEKLSAINEIQVIDLDDCLELTLQIWKTRYRMVFEAHTYAARQFTHLMISCGGVDIPPEIAKVAHQYPGLVPEHGMFEDLKTEQDHADR